MLSPPLRGGTLCSVFLICMLSLAKGRADNGDMTGVIVEAEDAYKSASEELKTRLSSFYETCTSNGEASKKGTCLNDATKQEMEEIVKESDEVVALTEEAVTQLQTAEKNRLEERQASDLFCRLLVRAIEILEEQIRRLKERLENTHFPWWLRWLKRLLIRLLEAAIRYLQWLKYLVEIKCPGWFGGGRRHRRSDLINSNVGGYARLMPEGENRRLLA